jgi:hypothetical protein
MHGVIRSAGSWTYTGTQFPRFSFKMSCSTVASEGYAGSSLKGIIRVPEDQNNKNEPIIPGTP